MALDRWIALVFLAGCCAYGYVAWFGMDDALPPFMRRNPVWPSSFPKLLSVAGAVVALSVLVTQKDGGPKEGDIDYRRLGDYKLGQAAALVAMMVAYAFLLRPFGFVGSTTAFLIGGALVLGERKLHILIPVALVAAFGVWWLVQEVLGIFLRPWPIGL
jgi:putative tricarboxylic transport membrane protein